MLSRFDKFLIVFFVLVLGIIFVSSAVNVDLSKPYHILQQISKSASDLTSIDSDSDGLIDLANSAIKIKCPDGNYREAKDCNLIENNSLISRGNDFVFISPTEIYSGTGIVSWTTYDASGIIPYGATAVILESEFSISGPNNAGTAFAYIKVRKDNLSPSYLLAKGGAWGSGDGVSDASQAIFPITTDRKFDYSVELGFEGTAKMRIVGYVIPGTSGTGDSIPIGTIVMWSGSIASIPIGWALCDGTNGTPDLRGRFIVGYNSTDSNYDSIGDIGGSKTVSLTTPQLPAHTHLFNTITNSSGAHTHTYIAPFVASAYPVNRDTSGNSEYGPTVESSTTGTTNSSGAHSHTISGSTNSVGEGQPIETRPPYYTLAFIIKK